MVTPDDNLNDIKKLFLLGSFYEYYLSKKIVFLIKTGKQKKAHEEIKLKFIKFKLKNFFSEFDDCKEDEFV